MGEGEERRCGGKEKRSSELRENVLTSLSRSTLQRLTASSVPPPGGRVANGLDDNQTTIQELKAEEDKTTAHHIQFKTWHAWTVDDHSCTSTSD